MNSRDWLNLAEKQLAQAGIGTARLDAMVLLEDSLQRDRSYILAHPEHLLTAGQLRGLNSRLKRRLTHEPLAYIRGMVEFYGRNFFVDKRVLQPRPETETMIDLLKASIPKQSTPFGTLIDVGTGSGCLAVTAGLEFLTLKSIATDNDAGCLAVARKNAKKLGAKVRFYKSDLLAGVPAKALSGPVIMLANLPYVPDNFQINQAALQEPHQAIYGGGDGLNLYRVLFKQLAALPQPPGLLLTESLPPQHQALTEIAQAAGYHLSKTSDFIQLFSRY